MAQWGRNQLSLGAAIVTLFLLASCGGTNRVEAVPQTEARIRIPARISQISDLEVTLYNTYGGAAERLSLADFHGEPVGVIFWAGLCPTSKVQMRELQAVHSQSSSINILGVDIGPFLGFEFRKDGGSVSNQQKWDTLGAESSGAGWRSGELPEGPVVASSPFGGLSLHILPAL